MSLWVCGVCHRATSLPAVSKPDIFRCSCGGQLVNFEMEGWEDYEPTPPAGPLTGEELRDLEGACRHEAKVNVGYDSEVADSWHALADKLARMREQQR